MSIYEFKPEDAERFAHEVNIRSGVRGDERIFEICPYCRSQKDKRTFAINLKTGQFKCLRASCGAHGNMITLSKDFDFSLGNDVDEYYRGMKQFRNIHRKNKPVPKPFAEQYMEGRGISSEVTNRYHITTRNDRPNVLLFPFYDENDVLTFVKYRNTDPEAIEKYGKEYCERDCKPILFGMAQCDPEQSKTLVLTEGQCFNGDAEIMTPDGWCRLEDYKGDMVLQVNEDMSAAFVKPKAYIVKRHQGKMVDVGIGGNYFTSTTDDHNLVFIMRSGKVIKKKACEKISTAYSIPTAIEFNAEKADWSNDEIALLLAISADGTLDFRKNTYHKKAKANIYARFGLTKERKVERLKGILDRLGYEYSDSVLDKPCGQYHSICFGVPNKFNSKYLPWWFVTETSLEQKKFIIEEMVWWDGNHVNGRNQYEYQSIYKHNVDVIQAVASTCGYMSTVRMRQSGGNSAFKKGFLYKASILLGKKDVSTQQFEVHKKIYDVDKLVYCVTVDSGMILVRQNNRISVSGNCDTLAVAEAGIPNPVSVPTGAKGFTWVPYCWDFMSRFDTLIVFGDHENGHITLLEEMRSRFQGTIKHVREEDYKECKDANELLQAYGKQAVRAAVENAVLVPDAKIIPLSSVERKDLSALEKFPSGIKALDRTLGGFYLGQLIVLTGERGEGKSTLASQFAGRALNAGYTVFFYSGELMDWYFRAWFDQQLAGPSHVNGKVDENGETEYCVDAEAQQAMSEWYGNRMYLYNNDIVGENTEEVSLISTLETAIKQYGCRVIFLDNLMTAIDYDSTSDIYMKQTVFVKELALMAKKFNVLIMLIAHPRKRTGMQFSNDDVAGSANVTNLADVVMRYARPEKKIPPKGKGKDDDDDDDLDDPGSDRVLQVWKNRLTGKTNKGIPLFYDERSRRISDGKGLWNWKLGWEEGFNGKPDDGFLAVDDDFDGIPFD